MRSPTRYAIRAAPRRRHPAIAEEVAFSRVVSAMRDALIDAVGRVESNDNASYWIDMTLGRGVSGSVNKYAPAVSAVAVELVAIMIDRGTLGADRADANRPLALRAINSLIKGA